LILDEGVVFVEEYGNSRFVVVGINTFFHYKEFRSEQEAVDFIQQSAVLDYN